MEFGENALKNKLHPLVSNNPNFNDVLINKKDSTWAEAYEGMFGWRWDYLGQQEKRFFSESADAIPNNYSLYGPAEPRVLKVDPVWKADFVEKIKNGEIPDEEMRWLPVTKNSINEEDYNQNVKNQEQLAYNKELMDNSSLFKLLVVGMAMPENIILLPTGGAAATTLGFTLKGFATAFTSMVLFESSLEALKWNYDAESDLKSSALNVAVAGGAAGFLNAGLKFGTRTYSNKVLKNSVDNLNEMNNVLFKTKAPTKEKIAIDLTFNKSKVIAKGQNFLAKKLPERSSKVYGTDSKLKKFILTAVPSAYKSWNNNFKGTATYDYMSLLLNDHSLLTVGNLKGFATPNSVYTLSKIRTGQTVWKINNQLNDLWALESGLMPNTATTVGLNRASIAAGMRNNKLISKWKTGDNSVGSIDDWLSIVNYKAIKNPKLLKTKNEIQAAKLIDDYFKAWEPLLRDRGLIGSGVYWKARVKTLEKKVVDLETKFKTTIKNFKSVELTKPKNLGLHRMTEKEYIAFANTEIKRIKVELDDARQFFADSKLQKVQSKNDPHYFARFWSSAKILQNRKEFENILVKWYSNQTPRVDAKTGQPIIRTKEDIVLESKKTIALILSEADNGVNIKELHIAGNVSKHSKGRELTIPNHLVVDFIETNPMAVIRSYDQRMTPRYEFDLMFSGKNIDELIHEIKVDGLENGMSLGQVKQSAMHFRHSYDVMMRQNIRNPARWDTRQWKKATDLAGLWYLPNAVLGTITEPAIITLNHGWRTWGKSLGALINLKNPDIGRIKQDMPRWYGEAMELAFFGSQHRFDGNSQYASPIKSNWENVVNSFYLLNGLTHATTILKNWESLARAHSIIDYSKKWSIGQASKFEQQFLLRGGIDEDMAKIIAAAPTQNTKVDGSGLYLANIDKWKGKVNDDVITSFQGSMSDGILNTIIMGTPADRPIIMDNVLYVRMRLAKFIPGLKEDPKFSGYARVENAVWSKPLQFYSYLLAATTKITGAVAQGMISNKQGDFVFLAALAFGMGNLQYQWRTPNWKEEQHTWADVVSRSIDYSGMLSLFSDAFYQGLHFSGEMGYQSTLETPIGTINPKFDTTDPPFGNISAITGLFGAVPSLVEETAEMTRMVYNGQYEEVGAQWIGRLPFLNLWFMEKSTNMIGKVLR